jgi:hypothetical protein
MNKKITIIGSGAAAMLLVIVDSVGTDTLCGGSEYTGCMRGLHSFFTVFLPVFPFFLFSLLTYFLRDDAFRKWARFAIPATFVSMVLIAITPDSYANGFGPQVSIGKGDAALVLSALFVLISLSIIGRAYLRPASK